MRMKNITITLNDRMRNAREYGGEAVELEGSLANVLVYVRDARDPVNSVRHCSGAQPVHPRA
jgi:hypothetical protein